MKRLIKFRVWDGVSLNFYPTIWNGKVWNALEDREEKGVELMQFTGLEDSKGVEIYEGDIDKRFGKVIWLQETCEYVFENKNGWTAMDSSLEIYISGNEFENPELL